MPKSFEKWTVLKHSRLAAVEDNILTVEGAIPMPVGNMTRRMTIVRLRDRRLVIFSAIALNEDEMRTVEKFGTPAFLLVPNAHHRLDSKTWKDRYPDIVVVAPKGAREKIQEVVSVNATQINFGDPDVALVPVPGTDESEFALEVRRPGGTTLLLNDLVGNIRETSGIGGWLLRLMGFAGDRPQVPTPIKIAIVKDKHALAAQFRRWAEMPLKRILVSHGRPIERRPSETLQELAAALE